MGKPDPFDELPLHEALLPFLVTRRGRPLVERVLRKRGLPVSAEHRARLASCEELTTLERWHDQAITAASTEDALR